MMYAQKKLKILLSKLVQETIEELIRSINVSPYISSQKNIKELELLLYTNSIKLLFKKNTLLAKNFEEIGFMLFSDYHVPVIIWQKTLKKFQEDILYAIHHEIIDYDADKLIRRIKIVENALYKGYFYAYVQETQNALYNNIEPLKTELDITRTEESYRKVLDKLNTNNLETFYELEYENSVLYQWSHSLDFQLLMRATSFTTKSNVLILIQHIHNLAKEIVFFAKKNDYLNAYNFLTLLDQKVNIVNNTLQRVLLCFNNAKLRHFFSFFADTILFNKHFSYFLTVSIAPTLLKAHTSDIKRLFLSIYRKVRKDSETSDFDFTGVIDNSNAIHLLLHYNTKDDIDKMMQLLQDAVHSLQDKEILLIVPEFIIRAAETEKFSGLDAHKLQQLSLKMASVQVDMPSYLFTEEECSLLRKDVEADNEISDIIIKKLQSGDIELYFQPIVHITKQEGKFAYCEALLRLLHDNEILSTPLVIATAKKENLEPLLDRLVFEKLSKEAATIAKATQSISANIFVESFQEESVMQTLKECLQTFKQHKLTMTLEITEYNLFEHYQKLESLYREFPDTLQIAIDDFGSGYSSLAALIQFSSKKLLHTIKIDGSLIKNILHNEKNYEVVRMAMELAQKLEAKIIVEYVETEEIYKKLQEIEIPYYAQGHYFSKAMSLKQLLHFQRTRQKTK